jgi:signal transduction histidine kinase
VVESTTDGVIVLNRAWRVVFMNGHARAIIGDPDLLGKNFWEALPRPAGGVFEDASRKAMAERTPMRCQDFYEPMEKWFENSIYPCAEGIVVYFRDITEEKRRELARRESEGTIRRQLIELGDVYTSAPVGLALLGADLRFLRVNQQIADINGLPAAAHVGKTIGEILPDFVEFFEPIARRVLKTGEPVFDIEVEGETPGVRTRRSYREQWLPQKDVTGKVVAINIVVLDVTNEKRIERELRDRVEELQALLDAVPAAVFVAHERECRTMYGNRTTAQLLRQPYNANLSKSAGLSAPRNFRVLKDGVEISPEEMPVQKAATTGKTVRQFELTLAFDGGDRTYIYGNATPLFDSGGKTRGAVGAFVDITGLVEAREATQRRDAELKQLVEERTRDLFEENERLARQIELWENAEQMPPQAQKQDAMGLVASGVAQDINKLLQVIASALEKIELQPQDPAIARNLMTAQGALQRAAGLTHRLHELAQNQQLSPTVIDANKHVVSVCDLLRQTIGSEVRIRQNLAPDLWPIRVDSNQFDLALLHLAANSRDAMPGGGGLLIVTSKNHAANDATLPRQIAGRNCVCIAVCDTGRGMSESVLARALEPFFDESEGNWTGLGLSIIAGFARKSGGTVRIRSSLGLGTVVEIFLPKAVETEPTA